MKKRKENTRTHSHLNSIRSSEMLGLSTYGETVKITRPVSGGHKVMLMDSAEEGQLCNPSVDN